MNNEKMSEKLEEPLDLEREVEDISKSEQPKIKYTREFLLPLAGLEVCSKLPVDFDPLISQLEQPKIKYTREFLLSFSELEVCCEFPKDFDLLISHELDDAVDGIENQKISSDSPLHGLLVSTSSDSGLPGENWDSLSFMPSKENQSQVNPNSERSGVVCQFSPGVTGNEAGILGSKSPRRDLFQLRNSTNPYRPPHFYKKVGLSLEETDPPAKKVCSQKSSPLWQHTISSDKHNETNSASLSGSDENKACVAEKSEVKGSDAGGITQSVTSREFNNDSPPTKQMKNGGPTIVTKKMLQAVDAISDIEMLSFGNFSVAEMEVVKSVAVDSKTGNDKFEYEFPLSEEVGFSNTILGKCEASWKNKEGSGLMAVADKVESEMVEDDEIKFDDVWAEITEILLLEQQSEVKTPTARIGDLSSSEIDFCLLDDSFDITQSTKSECPKFIFLDECDDAANSEAQITLPDEDNLITIDDLISPHSSTPTHNRDAMEVDKLTPNMAVFDLKNPKALNLTELDRRAKWSSKGSVTRGELHCQKSCPQTSRAMFSTQCRPPYSWNDQRNFLTKFTTPSMTPPYMPTHNCYTHSPSLHQPFQKTTLASPKPNDLLVRYSLSQQPNFGFDTTKSRVRRSV